MAATRSPVGLAGISGSGVGSGVDSGVGVGVAVGSSRWRAFRRETFGHRGPATGLVARLHPHHPFAVVGDRDLSIRRRGPRALVQVTALGPPVNTVFIGARNVIPVQGDIEGTFCGADAQPSGLGGLFSLGTALGACRPARTHSRVNSSAETTTSVTPPRSRCRGENLASVMVPLKPNPWGGSLDERVAFSVLNRLMFLHVFTPRPVRPIR